MHYAPRCNDICIYTTQHSIMHTKGLETYVCAVCALWLENNSDQIWHVHKHTHSRKPTHAAGCWLQFFADIHFKCRTIMIIWQRIRMPPTQTFKSTTHKMQHTLFCHIVCVCVCLCWCAITNCKIINSPCMYIRSNNDESYCIRSFVVQIWPLQATQVITCTTIHCTTLQWRWWWWLLLYRCRRFIPDISIL